LLLAALALLPVPLVAAGGGEAVRILANGSVHPPNAPLVRVGDVYVLVGSIDSAGDGLVVERSGIVVDGGGHELRGRGAGRGVVIAGATNVTLRRLRVVGFEYGVVIEGSAGCRVEGLTVEGGRVGIGLWGSRNCTLAGNVVRARVVGIHLEGSSGVRVVGNAMEGCGMYVRRSYGNVVENNTVNGRPLAYLEGASALIVTGDYGQVLLVRCRGIRVEGLSLSRVTVGVLVSECSGVEVRGVRVADSVVGIDVWNSSGVVVAGSRAVGCRVGVRASASELVRVENCSLEGSDYGAYVESSTGVALEAFAARGCPEAAVVLRQVRDSVVLNGSIEACARGIVLVQSSGVEVRGNVLWRNGCGVLLNSSAGNAFLGNEFAENSVQVLLEGAGPNFWSGNFWSDLQGGGRYAVGEGNVDESPLQSPRRLAYLRVSSPIGVVVGSGWYPKGTRARVGVWPANLLFLRFEAWVDSRGRVVASEPVVLVSVEETMEVRALWRPEPVAIVAAAALAALALLRVRSSAPKRS